MTKLQTLAEIWESNDRKPIKVINIDNTDILILFGILDNMAYLKFQTGRIVSFWCGDKLWKLYTEPKEPKRFWPGIWKDSEGGYHIGQELWESLEQANKSNSLRFPYIRLTNADDFKNGFLVED